MEKIIIFIIVALVVILLLTLFLYYNKVQELKNVQLYNCASSSKLYLKTSNFGGKYGRGVFSNTNFEPGDIIELAPYIEDYDYNFSETGLVNDYLFKKNRDKSVVVFGFASIYNHTDNPNAKWGFGENYFIITCITPIKKDQEIFISYGDEYWESRKWLKKK